MSFKGSLTTGKSCRITIESAPAMPGTLAFALSWVSKGASGPDPVVSAIAPGGRWQNTIDVPEALMLLLDIDVPVDHISNVTITVEQDAQVVATGSTTADTEWTFMVVP